MPNQDFDLFFPVMNEESMLVEMICELPAEFGDRNEVSGDTITEHDLVDGSGVSTFVSKLWDMLHDPTARQYIKWADCSGESIVIADHVIFSTRILSRFEQSKKKYDLFAERYFDRIFVQILQTFQLCIIYASIELVRIQKEFAETRFI